MQHRWLIMSGLARRAFALALYAAVACPIQAHLCAQEPTAGDVGHSQKVQPRFLMAVASLDRGVRYGEVDVSRMAMFRRRVSLHLDGVPLTTALAAIRAQTGLALVYSREELPQHLRVRLTAEDITVAAALTEMLLESDLDVVIERDGQIALMRRRVVDPPALAGSIVGRVTDADGTGPVESVLIAVQGTRIATTTNDSGFYQLGNVPAGVHQVSARRLGFTPATKAVTVRDGSATALDFAITRSVSALHAVIVTVTGEQSRYQVANAIATMRVDSVMNGTPVSNLADLLANRVAGAVVKSQNGYAGTVAPIRLRGLNSFTVSNRPIVIVDGARIEATATGEGTGGNVGGGLSPAGSARLGDLNLDEMESFEVVKGPAAATLYGTDAANGVLIIKTKRGRPGRLRWEAYGEAGSIVEDAKLVPDTYRGWGHSPTGALVAPCTLTAILAAACVQDSVTSFHPMKHDPTTFIHGGRTGTVGLQASGGTGQLRYLLSSAWVNEVGWERMPLVEETRLKREQGLASIPDEQLRPNALNKVNLRGNLTADFGGKGDLTLANGLTRQSFRAASPFPFVWGVRAPGYDDPVRRGYLQSVGEYFQLRAADAVTRYISSLGGSYRPATWLTTRASLGFDHSVDVIDNLQLNGQGPIGAGRAGQRTTGNNVITQYSFDAGVAVTRSISTSLGSKSSIGVQYNRRSQQYTAVSGTGLPPGSQTISGAAVVTPTELHADAIVAGSYLEQEFGWRDRLFVTMAVRADGASTFGQNLHTALYPKFGVSWVASEEPFVPKIPGVTSLRLRGAFGSSGVQPPSTSSVTSLRLVTGAAGGITASGVLPGAFGNPDVGPERQTELEGGFDLDAWGNRFHTEVTGYSRKSTDALVLVPIAASAGGGSTYQNVGSVSNRGVEMLVTVRPVDRTNVTLDLTLNGSINANKLVSTYPNAPAGFFQSLGLQSLRHRVGYPLYGVWQMPILSYADQNANQIIERTEVVVGDTEVYLGPSSATKQIAYSGSLGLWRDVIRITAQFDWRGGYKILNYTALALCGFDGVCRGNNIAGPSTFKDQAAIQAFTKVSSTYGFISDGAFTRLRELSVTTRLPGRVLRSTRATAGSLSFGGRNLWLWTKWPGGDPEIGYVTGTDQAMNFATPPLPRIFTARIRLSY